MTPRRFICLLALAGTCLFGQAQSNSGDIRGVIQDPSGGAIPGAKATLTSKERGITRSVESSSSGDYSIPLVPPGRYSLLVEAKGFAPKTLDGIEVRVGDVVSLDVAMQVGDVATTVEVSANSQVIEVERVQQSNTVDQRAILNLPINRRNFLDFAQLAPGVTDTSSVADDLSFRPIQTPNSGLSFGGSNGRGNGFFIDGFENYVNSGGVRPTVTQEAAQEFQINRNSFSAEFGNASGGIVNIITRGGTNDLHGNMFGFLRHRNIQARNFFDPTKSAFTRVQAGATLGGAIKKDSTFFFLGFERLDRSETNFVPLLQDRSVFNRLTTSQNELFAFFDNIATLRPLAAGARAALTPGNNPRVVQLFTQNSGTFPFGQDNTVVSLRLDHRFSASQSLFFRTNFTSDLQNNATFGAQDAYNRSRAIDNKDWTSAVGYTWILSPRLVADFRGMFNYYALDVVPVDQNGPEITIAGFGNFGRQIFLPYSGIERHYQLLQNWNYAGNRHSVKFGYDFNPVRNNTRSETFLGGRFAFGSVVPLASVLISASGDPNLPTTLAGLLTQAGQQRLIPNLSAPITALQAFSLGLPTLYQQGFGDPNYISQAYRNNLYVQDNWRLSSALTLTFGLRYELERQPPVVPRDNNNIAPRFGFAWSPAGQKLVIRGGYGLYYSMINAQVPGVADPLSGRYINQVVVALQAIGYRNPITGQPLLSSDIYQTLLRQGVIGSRTIQASDLLQFGLRPGPGLPLSAVFGVDQQNFRNPYSQQASFEIERAFGGYGISLGYNFNRGAHLAFTRGRNVAYSGTRLPDGRPQFVRINPLVSQLNLFEASANSFYHAGILQVTKRYSNHFAMNANYTWSKAMDESTDFNSDYSPQDQLNRRAERALSAFHQGHRLVVNGVFDSVAKNAILKDWQFSPIVIASSFRPFNVLTGVDYTGGDGYVNNKRPAHLGRNMGRGPNYFTLDARLARKWQLSDRWRMEFIAEGFNLANRTNFRTVNNVVGDVPYSTLGSPIEGKRGDPTVPLSFTSAQNPRQFQFGVKLNF